MRSIGWWMALAGLGMAAQSAEAQACEKDPEVSVVPSWGEVPAGTRIRVAGIYYEPGTAALVDAGGIAWPLALSSHEDNGSSFRDANLTWSVFAPPLDLPEGAYTVTVDGTSYGEVIYADGPATSALEGAPALLSADAGTYDYYPDTCQNSMSATWDRVVASWSLPAAPGPGWVAEVSEARSGLWLGYAELEPEATSFSSFFGAPEGLYEEVCLRLNVYDPLHALAFTREYPCVALNVNGLFAGCGCAQAGQGRVSLGVGLFALLALVWIPRRRAPG